MQSFKRVHLIFVASVGVHSVRRRRASAFDLVGFVLPQEGCRCPCELKGSPRAGGRVSDFCVLPPLWVHRVNGAVAFLPHLCIRRACLGALLNYCRSIAFMLNWRRRAKNVGSSY